MDKTAHSIILHPYVTEKTMFQIERENKLEFVVKRDASKEEIKNAVESLFAVEVEKVNTRITKSGKHAIVKLAKRYSAEEIGMRIGVF